MVVNESLKTLAMAYTILRTLAKPFTEMEAFKQGLIDKDGKKIRKARTPEEKASVDLYSRLILNIKRILKKISGGGLFGSAVIGAYLLKESTYTDEEINTIVSVIQRNNVNPYMVDETYTEEDINSMIDELYYEEDLVDA